MEHARFVKIMKARRDLLQHVAQATQVTRWAVAASARNRLEGDFGRSTKAGIRACDSRAFFPGYKLDALRRLTHGGSIGAVACARRFIIRFMAVDRGLGRVPGPRPAA